MTKYNFSKSVTEMFDAIITKANDVLTEEEIAFLNDRKEKAVAKRKSNEKAKAEKADADKALLEKVTEVIRNADAPLQASAIGDLVELSSQKVSSLVKPLIDNGELFKVDIDNPKGKGAKVKAYTFTAPEAE